MSQALKDDLEYQDTYKEIKCHRCPATGKKVDMYPITRGRQRYYLCVKCLLAGSDVRVGPGARKSD